MCLLIYPSFAVTFTTSFNSNHYNIIYIVMNNITFKFNINNMATNTVTHRTIWNPYAICIIRYTSNAYTIQITKCIRFIIKNDLSLLSSEIKNPYVFRNVLIINGSRWTRANLPKFVSWKSRGLFYNSWF